MDSCQLLDIHWPRDGLYLNTEYSVSLPPSLSRLSFEIDQETLH